MPIINNHFTIAESTRVLVASADNMPQDIWVHEADHSESTTVLLGNATVDNTNGLHLHAGETMSMTLRPGDVLYAYSSQGAPVVHVLQIQKND